MFDRVKVGDNVVIQNKDGTLDYGRIWTRTDTTISVSGFGTFYAVDGRSKPLRIGRIARPANPGEIEALQKAAEERLEAADKAAEAKAKADFEALPEPVKLLKRVRFLFDTAGDKDLVEAPIDALRAIYDWAAARGLEME